MNKKQIKSKDEKLCIEFKHIQNVCICYSLYPLLQYLLLFDENITLHRTCFFLGSGGIHKSISDRLPAFYFNTNPTKSQKEKILRIFQKLWIRVAKYRKYPFLRTASIYAQDFGYLSILIGEKDYAMLSEASCHLSLVYSDRNPWFQKQTERIHSLKGKIESLMYGKLATHIHGNNKQCTSFYLTEENFAPVLSNKQVYIASLSEMWNNSNQSKQEAILSIFGTNKEELLQLRSKPVWFFTQPLVKDAYYKESDYILILKNILKNYDQSTILIKTHPRDNFDYNKYFPNIPVFTKPIGMQLLIIGGVQIEKAVTLCSTAVDLLPETTQIDWYGLPQKHLLIHGINASFPFNRSFNQKNL